MEIRPGKSPQDIIKEMQDRDDAAWRKKWGAIGAFIVGAIILITIVSLLSPDKPDDASRKLSRADFGNDWPFTVESGTVKCVKGTFVVFEANGHEYAVSGSAQTHGRVNNLGWRDVDEIWADNPEIPGAKKSIGVIIDTGRALCK